MKYYLKIKEGINVLERKSDILIYECVREKSDHFPLILFLVGSLHYLNTNTYQTTIFIINLKSKSNQTKKRALSVLF